jgi:hypothetical protein
MEIKKIVYLGDFTNEVVPDKNILKSLQKRFEVKKIDVRKFNLKRSIRDIMGCDLFLFHGQMGNFDKATYYYVLGNLKLLLEGTSAKKVLWMFDKIWFDKFGLLLEFEPIVDKVLVSDGTWMKRFDADKIHTLHPAAPDKPFKGKFRKEFACDIAYFGTVYGDRERELDFIKKIFGSRVKVFNNKFGKDFADLCKSAKIVMIPRYPFDDFFWSDRIYNVLACGGFPVCQRSYGLDEQGLVEGKHYMAYNSEPELVTTLKMMLDKSQNKSRKLMAEQGQRFVMKNHTYNHRIDEILSILNEN